MEKVNGMKEQMNKIIREMEILLQNQKEMVGKNTATSTLLHFNRHKFQPRFEQGGINFGKSNRRHYYPERIG